MSIFAERDAKWQKKLDDQAEKARKLKLQLRIKKRLPRNPFNKYALGAVTLDIRRLKEEKAELLLQLQRREHRENNAHDLVTGLRRGLASGGTRSDRGGQLYR